VSEGPFFSTAPPAAAPATDSRSWLRRYVGLPANGFNWVTAVIAFFAALFVGVVGSAFVAAFDPELDSNAAKLAAQAAVVISFVGAAIGVALVDAGGKLRGALDRFGLRRVALSMLGIAALGWFIYFIVQAGLGALIAPEQEDVTEQLGTDDTNALSVIATALLVVPGAALSEELLFRGVIFAGLRKSMSLWPAALISSGIWASLHLVAANWAVAAILAIFGLVLAWLYERTGSLWTPIFAHAINNTLAVLVLFLA
jgi:membrane protease YdiL (CAAX protease family)